MIYYGYDEFRHDLKTLGDTIVADRFRPDAIVAIARGGLTLAHCLAHRLEVRTVFSMQAKLYEGEQKLEGVKISAIPDLTGQSNVLIVDEIVDSGETMAKVVEILSWRYPATAFRVAVLFQKPSACFHADYTVRDAAEWINFFWEADSKEERA